MWLLVVFKTHTKFEIECDTLERDNENLNFVCKSAVLAKNLAVGGNNPMCIINTQLWEIFPEIFWKYKEYFRKRWLFFQNAAWAEVD